MPSVPLDHLGAPALPLVRGTRGYFKMAFGEDVISNSIVDIISTRPGQRVMRPQYGCLIHELVFDPADDITLALAKRHIKDALERNEKRIAIVEILAEFDFDTNPSDPRLLGQVKWELKSSRAGNFFTTDFDQSVRR